MASDQDFIDALSDSHLRKEAAGEFLKRMVGAAKGLGKVGLEAAKENKLPIGAALLGAAAAGTGGYLWVKPGKDGKPSRDQRFNQDMVDSAERAAKEDKEDGKKPSLRTQVTRAAAPGVKGISDVLAKHPIKAGLMVAPVGAAAALKLLKALK